MKRDCRTGLVFADAKLTHHFGWEYKRNFPTGDFKTKVRWNVQVGKKSIMTKEVEISTEKPKLVDHEYYEFSIIRKKSG